MEFDLNYTFKSKDIDSFLKAGALLTLPNGEYFLGLRPLGTISDPEGETLFYAQKFFGELLEPFILYGQRAQIKKADLLKILSTVDKVNEQKDPTWTEPEKMEFLNTFELILNEMDKGKLKIAVPIVFEHAKAKVTPQMKANFLINLLNADHGGYAFAHWDEDFGIIGLTPELLFEKSGDEIRTVALAGTAKTENEFSEDQKLKTEHNVVIEDILARLKSLGVAEVEKTALQKFGSIYHLKTDLIFKKAKQEATFDKLIAQLHPTAALGVFPREFDWQWLRNLGGLRRRQFYGAPIGLRDADGNGFAYVAIRSLQWDSTEMWISSGAGMLADSDPEKEWEELKLKRDLTKKILGFSH